MKIDSVPIVGVILAGGQGRRMGGAVDKPLMPLGDGTLLSAVLARATPQCDAMILNANGNANSGAADYAGFGLPVVADGVGGFLGPLAGILAGMDWVAKNLPHCPLVMSFAGDAPFIPLDLVARLAAALEAGAEIARPCSFGRRHPVFCLWPTRLRAELRDQLINKDVRKIDQFTANYRVAEVLFDGIPDPFFNVNTPDERAEAERIFRGGR